MRAAWTEARVSYSGTHVWWGERAGHDEAGQPWTERVADLDTQPVQQDAHGDRDPLRSAAARAGAPVSVSLAGRQAGT